MMESILGKFVDEFQEFSINFDKATINISYYKKGLVLKSGALQVFFFYYLSFLSWTFTIHITAGEGGGYYFTGT